MSSAASPGPEPRRAGEPAPALLVVVGPTATGKTALALELARRLGGEVVGADAYQVYRHMDLGTAKPSDEERAGTAYHLVDVAEPDEPFDAHRYAELADRAVSEVAGRGAVPVVAGGTGLYVAALVRGLAAMPGRDPALRRQLEAEAAGLGAGALHDRLRGVDPAYAARVGPRDLVRIVRALEVWTLSGRTISELHAEHVSRPDRYPALWLGLDPGRQALRGRIERRTEAIFEAGLVEEVRRLREMGYGPDLPSMRALGYGPAHRVAEGRLDEAEARRLTTRDTARYARRQRTWFRALGQIEWLDGSGDRAEELAREFLGRGSEG